MPIDEESGCRFPGTVFPGNGFDQPHDDDQNGRRTDLNQYVKKARKQQELHCWKICFLCPSRYGRRQCPWCSGGRKNLPLCDHRCLPDHVSAYGRDGSGLSAGSCACCFTGSSFLYHGRNAFCLWKGTGKYRRFLCVRQRPKKVKESFWKGSVLSGNT